MTKPDRALPRLITISISHYCEKGRWALDRAGIEYVEEAHAIAFHLPALILARGGLTVPALRRPGASTVAGSDGIVRFCDETLPAGQRLVVSPEAEAWERRLDTDFGPLVRRWAYSHVPLRGPALLGTMREAPTWEQMVWKAGAPVFKTMARVRSGSTQARVEAAWDGVVSMLDAVADTLSDGRRYLTGDRFTVADLTFASLAAPMFRPPTWGGALVDPDDLTGDSFGRVAALSDHPAAQFVLRVYEEQRTSVVG